MSHGRAGIQAAIVAFSVRFRGVVLALACIVLGYGVYALARAKYDVFPEFAPPQVSIQTEAPGLSPEQVEVLVTQPIENAVNGVPGVDKLRSASIQGLSIVSVLFDPQSDIYQDRQSVAERLTTIAGELPGGVQAPSMTPLTSSTGTILVAGLTSKHRTLMELRTLADWTVRLRLLAVPGVAKVAVFGGEVRQLQVQVHPERLARYNIGLNDVLAAAKVATGVRGAGFIDTANQRIVFQTEGQSIRADALARTVLLAQGGVSVTLGNIADVIEAPEPAIGGASINGELGVIFVISGQYGGNTVEITKRVEAALDGLKPALANQGATLHADLFRPANFIATATDNVQFSLILGGVLVVVVLFLFLYDLRTALISFTAIPLSLLVAVIVLEFQGLTLNTMTLGGLAIAIGIVVDDAVIGVENIVRRLRENRRKGDALPFGRVVFDACMEVRGAVVYATFAVVLVFLPVLNLSGIAGRLFAPLGFAYIPAVLASLVVALTVTPALSMVLLARGGVDESAPAAMRWSRSRYEAILQRVMDSPRAILVTAGVLTVAALAALPFLGTSFLPELKEGHFILHMSAVPGTSIAESLRIGDHVTKALRDLPAVRLIAQTVGRAEKADDTWGTHYSEFQVDLKPLEGEEAEFVQGDIRKVLALFPGVNFSLKPFLTERVEESLSGYTASVVVSIFGNDLDALDGAAREVAKVLGGLQGATEVQIQSPPGLPQLIIRLRPADLERWGFSAVDVLDIVRAAYQGDTVGQTYEGNKVFDVAVILDPKSRSSVAEIGTLPLRNSAGNYVQLRQLADIYQTSGRYQVLHEGARRLQAVTANVAGRDVGSFVAEAKAAIAKLQLPPGSYVEFSGAAEAQQRSLIDLIVYAIMAGVGVVLLLSIVTRNANNLLLILVNLPFAFVGGVLAVFATGGLMSLGSMVGFVTLFGITLRNSIMMISHYEHLVEVEGADWGRDTAVRGAVDRLVPIVMTSLVTALGLLPLALGMGEPGREIEGPMAVAILGGLVTSMALNLLTLPPLALRYGRFEKRADELP